MNDRLKACLTLRRCVAYREPWWERWEQLTGHVVPKDLRMNSGMLKRTRKPKTKRIALVYSRRNRHPN